MATRFCICPFIIVGRNLIRRSVATTVCDYCISATVAIGVQLCAACLLFMYMATLASAQLSLYNGKWNAKIQGRLPKVNLELLKSTIKNWRRQSSYLTVNDTTNTPTPIINNLILIPENARKFLIKFNVKFQCCIEYLLKYSPRYQFGYNFIRVSVSILSKMF